MVTLAAIARWRQELRVLLSPGRIGDFDHIELTEIVATPRGGRTFNVLSIAVFAEGRPGVGEAEETKWLSPRISIEAMKDCSFGVARTLRPLSALEEALEEFAATGAWSLSGKFLETGDLRAESPMFAPPDGTVQVPINRVLKNNFWAGSYVFRLLDYDKSRFSPFFADRRRLQELSDAVSQAVPMAISGLADLLGDVLIQIPVTILVPRVEVQRGVAESKVDIMWRRGSTPRSLVVAARTRRDELLTGAAVSSDFQYTAHLPIDGHQQPLESETWSTETGHLICATVSTSTLKTITIDVHEIQHEPRIFTSPDVDGQPQLRRLRLTRRDVINIGEQGGQDANYWLSRRQDLEEKRKLDETRDFVQYRPHHRAPDERVRAMEDLRLLINRHGQSGVDLWDPYLNAEDVIQTLFWCSHSEAPLRALTDGRDRPDPQTHPNADGSIVSFSDCQRNVFGRDKGNCQGLRLEYRIRSGNKGWGFHDRFLIFPNGGDGPQAWSLGTSVNSLGKAHHILQRVSNPAMVAGAFEDLWTALDEPYHVIWRSW